MKVLSALTLVGGTVWLTTVAAQSGSADDAETSARTAAMPGHAAPPGSERGDRGVRVETIRLASQETRQEHVFHGVVQPIQRAVLGFETGGRLEARPARVGDSVVAGQVLARLDRRGSRNAVRAARAQVHEVDLRTEQLDRDRARASELSEAGVTTRSQLEQAQSGTDRAAAMRSAARAQLAEAQRRMTLATLRAPFDGVVTDVLAESGEIVGPGQPVVRIVGSAGLEVVLQVDESVAAMIDPGADLVLRVSGLSSEDPLAGREVRGRVRSIVSESTGFEGMFPVVVDLEEDPQLRGGVGVDATLVGPPRAALRVPLSAVLDPSGRRPFVWLAVEGRAERAWVTPSRLHAGDVELADESLAGAEVIVRGHTRLLPGDRVEVAR